MGRGRVASHAARLIAGAVLGLVSPAAADEYDPTLTIQLDNDWFAGNDQDYTTGIRIAWLSDSVGVPEWLESITAVPRVFGAHDDNTVWRWGLSINQVLYTPHNTQATEPIPNDRPYAGWLALDVTLQAIRRDGDLPVRLDTFDVSLGVVGPWALGEELQNSFHNLLSQQESKGWDNQLDNEPAFQFTYERRWRTDAFNLVPDLLEVDAVPYAGLGLGNVQIYGTIGSIFRIGEDLRRDFGPPTIRPALPGSESFSESGFGWYLFAGLQGSAVAHSIFLDGNSFDPDSPSVDRIPWVGQGQAGLAIVWGDMRLTYTHTLRTPEFEERDRWQQFGAVTLSFSF